MKTACRECSRASSSALCRSWSQEGTFSKTVRNTLNTKTTLISPQTHTNSRLCAVTLLSLLASGRTVGAVFTRHSRLYLCSATLTLVPQHRRYFSSWPHWPLDLGTLPGQFHQCGTVTRTAEFRNADRNVHVFSLTSTIQSLRLFQTEIYECRHNIIRPSNIKGLCFTRCGLKKYFFFLYDERWNGRWQWRAAERRKGPRVLEVPPVLLQRLTLVFVTPHHASLPRQASVTSKLSSAVYYTKVTLEPGTRIPKTKLFLCM